MKINEYQYYNVIKGIVGDEISDETLEKLIRFIEKEIALEGDQVFYGGAPFSKTDYFKKVYDNI